LISIKSFIFLITVADFKFFSFSLENKKERIATALQKINSGVRGMGEAAKHKLDQWN
jgi:hypothetical protein